MSYQEWHEWLKRLCAERAKARAEAVTKARAQADSSMGAERVKRLGYIAAIEQEHYLPRDLAGVSPDTAIEVAEYLATTRILFRDGWTPSKAGL